MANYENYTKEQLIEEIKKIKQQKKFGLVWEDKPEQVVEECKRNFPVLTECSDKAIMRSVSNVEPTHLIIEGDNYHALSVLNVTHKGKIDVIYIDPPYNTGAKNWKYNNDYVDENDAFRHSKWLCMMEKRLRLAKNLLTDNGVIIVTIDDYEVATLRLLMDDIFWENNHLGTVVIKNNPSGRSTIKGFAIAHEYALFFCRSNEAKIGRLPRNEKQISRYAEKDSFGSYEWVNFRARYSTESPTMQYPIFIKKDGTDFRVPKLEWNEENRKFILFEQPKENELVKYPIDELNKLRSWKWSIETLNNNKETEMAVRLDKNKVPAVYVKARMKDEGMLPLTWWDKTEYSATSQGNNLLMSIMGGKVFDYPKSLYAVEDCLRVATNNNSSTILDFFAGSGTTGHAVLELNKEDNGNRQFILCTNNENNICEEVTYPRIKKVIEGYGSAGSPTSLGIPANVRYFKTDFVEKSEDTDENRVLITERCHELLQIKEGCYVPVETKMENIKLWKNESKLMAVIFDRYNIENDTKYVEEIKRHAASEIVVYRFSIDGNLDMNIASLPNARLEEIPEEILKIYNQIFKKNRKRK